MPTYDYYTTLDINLCVDGTGAFITLVGSSPDELLPIPVVAGTFSANWTGYGSYLGCSSGDIHITCVNVAPNTFQCTVTASNLDCSSLTGGYAPFSVNESITVVLDGNPATCVT